MIRALICDLDNTLFSADSIPAVLLDPIVDAVRKANSGPDAIPDEQLADAIAAFRRVSFDRVVDSYRLPPAVRDAWVQAMVKLRVTGHLIPFPDVRALAALRLRRFLVTTGYRGLQESKVRALGIGDLFEAVHVDALDDPATRPGKRGLFRSILAEHRFAPSEVVVLGDSAESEIAAGNRLGIPTVQVLRSGVERCEEAQFRIVDLTELRAVIAELDAR